MGIFTRRIFAIVLTLIRLLFLHVNDRPYSADSVDFVPKIVKRRRSSSSSYGGNRWNKHEILMAVVVSDWLIKSGKGNGYGGSVGKELEKVMNKQPGTYEQRYFNSMLSNVIDKEYKSVGNDTPYTKDAVATAVLQGGLIRGRNVALILFDTFEEY